MPDEKRLRPEISSAGTNLISLPDRDEVEISIFGPGYGESILLHLLDNNWFVVDSCIDLKSKEPAALVYLAKLGVDATTAVKMAIATHWHDDHIRGFSKIVEVCDNCEVVFSDALTSEEFQQLISAFGKGSMIESSGADEFVRVLGLLKERKDKAGEKYIPKLASCDKLLWRGLSHNDSMAPPEITCLSPSDAAKLASMLDFRKMLPKEKQPKHWLSSITPNRAAVALWVSVRDLSALLGADLVEDGNPQGGWSVILSSRTRPDGKAAVFKVPHHGSETAHHQQVWEEMLHEDPIAVITPFQSGNRKLPTPKDIDRVVNLTPNAFLTSNNSKRTIRRDHTVEKTIKETVRNMRRVYGSAGHVRIRYKAPDRLRIELFGDAKGLTNILDFKEY